MWKFDLHQGSSLIDPTISTKMTLSNPDPIDPGTPTNPTGPPSTPTGSATSPGPSTTTASGTTPAPGSSGSSGTGLTSPTGKSVPPPTPPPGPPPATGKPSGSTTLATGTLSGSTTSASGKPTLSFQPPTPKFGGLKQLKADEWAVWTGGKPNGTWTALETMPISIGPHQYRPHGIFTQAKTRDLRVAGLPDKFVKGQDLLTFQRELNTRMTHTGMDTILYVQSPIHPAQVVNIVDSHSLFDLASGVSASKDVASKHFDSYCHSNSQDAKDFLLNSLDYSLKKQLYDMCNPDDNFGVYWFSLMHIVCSVSVTRFDHVRDRIKGRTIDSYPEHDVVALCSDFHKDFKTLHQAGLYDHNLTLHMLNIIMGAGGTGNEDFKAPLRTLRTALNKQLLKVRHLSYADTQQSMVQAELDVQSVLNQCSTEYRSLLDNGLWPASTSIKDTSALPKSFGSVSKATTSIEHLAHALLQNLKNGIKPKGATPSKSGKPKQQSTNNKKKKKSQRPTKGRTPSNKPPPPKAGESEICKIDGSTYYWCKECDRWTLSHGTDGHKSNAQLKAEREKSKQSTNLARVDFDYQPSAHQADFALDLEDFDLPEELTISYANYGPLDSPTPPPQPSFWQAWKTILLKQAFLFSLIGMVLFTDPVLLLPFFCMSTAFVIFTYFYFRAPYTSGATTVSSSVTSRSRARRPTRSPRRSPPRHVTLHRVSPNKRTRRFIPKNPENRQSRRHAPKYNNLSRPDRREPPRTPFYRPQPVPHALRKIRNQLHARSRKQTRYGFRTTKLRHQLHAKHSAKYAKKDEAIAAQSKALRFWNKQKTNWHALFRSQLDATRSFLPRKKKMTARLRKRRRNQPLLHRVFQHTVHCVTSRLINLSNLDSTKKTRHPTADKKSNVLFDSGANCCITFDKDDFVGHYKPHYGNNVVDGIGKGLQVVGTGTVAWTFESTDGKYRTLKLPCLHVPSANTKIASLHQILKVYGDETINIDNRSLVLSGSHERHRPALRIPINKQQRLPVGTAEHNVPSSLVVHAASKKKKKQQPPAPILPTVKHPALTSPTNSNLTEAEKEILRWHQKLGHIHARKVQWLMKNGLLAHTETSRRIQRSAARLSSGPLCTACQYAKQRRKTKPGSVLRANKDLQDITKQEALFPGSRVFADHFVCNPPGRRFETYGKEPADKKLTGGLIFVDASSGFIDVHFESGVSIINTIAGKEAFERFCFEHGAVPQAYVTDKGKDFLSDAFHQHCTHQHQSVRHVLPGGHHATGIVERNIGTLMSISRAMLHHAALHWPEVANVELWPFAVSHAAFLMNYIPQESTGRSPYELFTRTTWPTNKLQEMHVWGCPVYVLEESLKNGKPIPRWRPRSERGIYVGQQMKHGHSVPLILNLSSGKVTSQYHVIFDDWFQTVDSASPPINFDHDHWYHTFGLTEWQYIPHDDPDELHDLPPLEDDVRPPPATTPGARRHQLQQVRAHVTKPVPLSTPIPYTLSSPSAIPEEPPVPCPPSVTPSPAHSLQRENDHTDIKTTPPHGGQTTLDTTPLSVTTPTAPPTTVTPPTPPPAVPPPNLADTSRPPPSSTSSAPTPSPTSRPSTRSSPKLKSPPTVDRRVTRSQTRKETAPRRSTRTTNSKYRTVNHAEGAHEFSEPEGAYDYLKNHSDEAQMWLAHKAAHNNPDIYTWDEAMASEYREEFLDAIDEEIRALEAKGTWTEDLKSNATTRILPSQWVLKIKRDPTGRAYKFKARAVLRGDLQEHNGESNFSPVAAWSTVRCFLIISMMNEWVTCTIDFSNAFVQSKLPDDDPVWMHIPRGYRSMNGRQYCLKLQKSLYGHRSAPLLWFNHSSDAFKKLGLVQSKHDECLWFGEDIMVVQYVDDCGISAPNQARIDKFVNDLRDLGFELTQEQSFEAFLGIKFEKLPDGSTKCTQRGLIEKILKTANMLDCNPNHTPARQQQLSADEDGESMNESWNYRAICGMLLYLSGNTRPDIAFAVSQVCRFGNNPKQSHATAVKVILRYLKKTIDEGITVNPNQNRFAYDMYCDADYCGLYGSEDPRNPDSVRSRTGYIIMLGGWPILWKSQLQQHLSQSTLEAEYISLSSSLKVFLPLKLLIEEIIEKTNCHDLEDTTLHSTVFEDNQSCYYLATNQRITSRTKYLLARWHWFWDQYNQGHFNIEKCASRDQRADYLTKSLSRELHENNRSAVQGW